MEHAEKVLGVTFISNDQTPEVLQPGKQPFDFPPAVLRVRNLLVVGRTLSFASVPRSL
jgi:hypothetical protein